VLDERVVTVLVLVDQSLVAPTHSVAEQLPPSVGAGGEVVADAHGVDVTVSDMAASTPLLVYEPAHFDRALLALDVEHVEAPIHSPYQPGTAGSVICPVTTERRCRRRAMGWIFFEQPGTGAFDPVEQTER
jgi:hypothetical protein